jgi:HAD superfamily hydrolase (TIGR01509 family)
VSGAGRRPRAPEGAARFDTSPGGAAIFDTSPGGAAIFDTSPFRAASFDTSPFRAAIFDMDGLLVDSEPLWHEAEVEVLGPLGVPIAQGDPRRTKGIFVGEVVRYWHDRYPWDVPSTEEVADRIVDRVIELVAEKGQLQPGVGKAVGLCRRHGLALALASSSEHRLIDFVLERFGLASTFAFSHSAEDEPYGKPHPAVFLTTAQRLGVAPDRCVVWEDAPAGVLAAKAARMTCVAVPARDEREAPAFAIADAVLGSLEEADEDLWGRLVAQAGVERFELRPDGSSTPG